MSKNNVDVDAVKTAGKFTCDVDLVVPRYLNADFIDEMLAQVDEAGSPLTYSDLRDCLELTIEYPPAASLGAKKEIDIKNDAVIKAMTLHVRWIEEAGLGKMLRGPVSGLARMEMKGEAGERKIIVSKEDMTDSFVTCLREIVDIFTNGSVKMSAKPELIINLLVGKLPGLQSRKARAMIDFALEHGYLPGIELKNGVFARKSSKAA